MNQLTQIKESTGNLEKYFYDTLGNRIQKEKTNPSVTNPVAKITKYAYNNENQMTTLQGVDEEVAGHKTSDLVTFTYDKRGNVRRITTKDGTIGQYYYDTTNKMTYSMNKMGITSSYVYDGAGRRVKQAIDASNINVPETSKLHDQELLEELMANDAGIILDTKKELNYIVDSTSLYREVLMVYGKQTKTQRYTYGNGLISIDTWNDKVLTWADMKQTNRDKLLYYVDDYNGSVRALVDDGNKVDKTYSYDIFGTPIEKNHVNDQGIRSNIYHYAGYIYDYATSQYYVNARYYMPEVGRFVAEDAYWGDGLNRYVYVRNNPLKFVDPSGYCVSEGEKVEIIEKAIMEARSKLDEIMMDVLTFFSMTVSGTYHILLEESYANFYYQNIKVERLNTEFLESFWGTADYGFSCFQYFTSTGNIYFAIGLASVDTIVSEFSGIEVIDISMSAVPDFFGMQEHEAMQQKVAVEKFLYIMATDFRYLLMDSSYRKEFIKIIEEQKNVSIIDPYKDNQRNELYEQTIVNYFNEVIELNEEYKESRNELNYYLEIVENSVKQEYN